MRKALQQDYEYERSEFEIKIKMGAPVLLFMSQLKPIQTKIIGEHPKIYQETMQTSCVRKV